MLKAPFKPALATLFNATKQKAVHLSDAYQTKFTPQKSRPLTEGEKQLAHAVFGNHLNMDDIKLKTAWWVLKNYAVSPNGNVYFHPKDWCEDFSQSSLGKQGWLIHELTHVWQLQQGLKVVRGAVINRRYEYAFEQGKSFFAYGIEQQARMVQDYFMRLQRGQDCQAWQACIPFLSTHQHAATEQTSKANKKSKVNK